MPSIVEMMKSLLITYSNDGATDGFFERDRFDFNLKISFVLKIFSSEKSIKFVKNINHEPTTPSIQRFDGTKKVLYSRIFSEIGSK